jgi:hypothetical protein
MWNRKRKNWIKEERKGDLSIEWASPTRQQLHSSNTQLKEYYTTKAAEYQTTAYAAPAF